MLVESELVDDEDYKKQEDTSHGDIKINEEDTSDEDTEQFKKKEDSSKEGLGVSKNEDTKDVDTEDYKKKEEYTSEENTRESSNERVK